MAVSISGSASNYSPYQSRLYALNSSTLSLLDPYVNGVPLESFNWIFDPSVGGERVTSVATGAPAWMLAGHPHLSISFRAVCKGMFVDQDALAASLLEVNRSPFVETPPVKLLSKDQVAVLVDRIFRATSIDSGDMQGKIDKFTIRVKEMRTLLDGGWSQASAATLKDSVTAFYLLASTTSTVEVLFSNAANVLYDAARTQYDKAVLAGTNVVGNASLMYSYGLSRAAAVAAIRAKLATFWHGDATSGIWSLDIPSLVDWYMADASLLQSSGYNELAANAEVSVRFLGNALDIRVLGYKPPTMANTGTTASAVAAKKAELESLGKEIDAYYSDLYSETSKGLESIISEFLGSMDMSDVLRVDDIVARIVDARFYVTTWVTDWGEESQHSQPSAMVEMDQNDVAVITNNSTVPTGLGVIGWRLYRSNSGSTDASFQLVTDPFLMASRVPASTLTRAEAVIQIYAEIGRVNLYKPTQPEIDWWVANYPSASYASLRATMISVAAGYDSGVWTESTWVVMTAKALTGRTGGVANSLLLPDGSYNCFRSGLTIFNDVSASTELQEVVKTTTWLPPPSNLEGLTAMANGVMAGFFDNTVCFSEAFTPYAWPVQYQVPVDSTVVALAAFGQTLIAFTRSSNYSISGTDPASMSAMIIPGSQICVSARSVAVADSGVIFASPEGICFADLSGIKVLTKGLFTREDWSSLNPSSLVGFLHDSVYYFTYDRTALLSGSFTGTPTQIINQAYADVGLVGAIAPSAERVAYWVSLTASLSLSNFALRKSILTIIANPVKEPTYDSTAAALAALASLTIRQVIELSYVQIGRTGLVAPIESEIAWWLAYQATYALSKETLRNTILAIGYNLNSDKAGVVSVDLALRYLNAMSSTGCMSVGLETGKLTTVDLQATACYNNRVNDRLYLLDGTNIKEMFTAPTQRNGSYRTGIIKIPDQKPFSWLQVDSDFTYPVVVKWRGDGDVRYTTALNSREPVRLPAGRYLEHELEISTRAQVTQVTLAGSTDELKAS